MIIVFTAVDELVIVDDYKRRAARNEYVENETEVNSVE